MKRTSVLLLPLLVLLGPSLARAQSPATEIQSLHVDIWPDYDRPSVLILLTGTLGSATPLPASVALPLPADATLNAVARIGESGQMVDDIAYHTGGGQLVLTTPDPRFRVEYYVPYRTQGGERSFEFTWRAEVAVDRLDVRIQKPAAAGSLVTVPKAIHVAQAQDGLVYHSLPTQAVPAGSSFPIRVRYTMTEARLSAPPREGAGRTPPARAAPTPASPGEGLGWENLLIGFAALAIVAIFVWQIARGRSAARAKGASRGGTPEATRPCAACGKPVATEDRFCRHCGATSDRSAPSSSDR